MGMSIVWVGPLWHCFVSTSSSTPHGGGGGGTTRGGETRVFLLSSVRKVVSCSAYAGTCAGHLVRHGSPCMSHACSMLGGGAKVG